MPTAKSTSNKNAKVGAEDERFTAALCYVWILCLYGLLFKKNSSFIQFHAKQGLALFVLEVIAPLLILVPVVWIICIVVSVVGVRQALAGKYWTMPLIGNWLKRTGI